MNRRTKLDLILLATMLVAGILTGFFVAYL